MGETDPIMTPEIWTILGTGITLAAIGIGGFTLLWRYITRAEQRTRADLAAAEQHTSGPYLINVFRTAVVFYVYAL